MENIKESELVKRYIFPVIGKVNVGRNAKTGETVTVRVLHIDEFHGELDLSQIEEKLSGLKSLLHPNIVQLHDLLVTETKIFLITEYVAGGDIAGKFKAARNLSEAEARKYFQQLITAVKFCHERGISHGDLKMENLLIDADGNLKMANFGFRTVIEELRKIGVLVKTEATRTNFTAPEITVGKEFDPELADVWSCGVILFHLLAGNFPSLNVNVDYMLLVQKRLYFSPWFSDEVRRLLLKLLDRDPATRVRVSRVLEDPWVAAGIEPQTSCSDSEELPLSFGAVEIAETNVGEEKLAENKSDLMKVDEGNSFSKLLKTVFSVIVLRCCSRL